MKTLHNPLVISLLLAALFMMISGCEYDVAEPQWDKDFTPPGSPVITEIIPANAAVPGVNKITIRGENFDPVKENNNVYFDNVTVDILSCTQNELVVLRPNVVLEACTIKVVSNHAFLVAKKGPYRVDQVLEQYGNFVEPAISLSVVAVDADENIFVIETSSRQIVKVTPGGKKSLLGQTSRSPYDAVVGPDGRLYLPENNRAIDVADLQTGEVIRWTRLPSGKVVKVGDFDSNGYYYTAGRRSGLVAVAPDEALTASTFDIFLEDDITALRVYENSIYVVVNVASPDAQNPANGIWRIPITAPGQLGEKQLVYDLDQFSFNDSSDVVVTGINFSNDEKMYISIDDENPMLVFDLASSESEYFYKGILPGFCRNFNWGSGNYIYMITTNMKDGADYTVYRVDMGTGGSKNY